MAKFVSWLFSENTSIFPFLTDEIMPVMVVFSVFGSCLVVYGAYYAIRGIAKRSKKKLLSASK